MLNLAQDVGGQESGGTALFCLGHHQEELLLVQRIQSARRLVQNQQLRLVHESLHQPHLQLIAPGIFAKLLAQVELQPLCDALDSRVISPASQVAEIDENLAPGQVIPQSELARQIPCHGFDSHAVGSHIFAEDAGMAAGGANQVHQHADGGGLARAIRPQEAEHFPGLHAQIQVNYAPRRAVILG